MYPRIEEVQNFIGAGDYKQAASACRKLIRKSGNSVESLSLFADVHEKQGKLESAIKLYKNALAYSADRNQQALLSYNIAYCCQQQALYEDAADYYQDALEFADDFPLCAFNYASLLIQEGRNEEALDCFERVLHSENLQQKSQYLLDHKTLVSLSRMRQYDWDEAKIKRLHELLQADQSPRNEGAAYCCYALANIYDRRKDYQQALDFYMRGNAIRQRNNPYDPAQNEQYVRAVCECFDADLVAACQQNEKGSNSASPIFILGMPRSGSTLTEFILAGHARVTALGELPSLSQSVVDIGKNFSDMNPLADNLARLSEAHIRFVRKSYSDAIARMGVDTAFFTDKMPENFAYLGFILLAFPKARIIHTVRNPMDVIWSCFQTDFGDNHSFSSSLDGLVDYYTGYERLMTHWKWLFGDRIYELRYEDLVRNNETETRKLLAFCGLSADKNYATDASPGYRVKTASLHQVREPINDRAVQKWKNYEYFLRPVADALSVG